MKRHPITLVVWLLLLAYMLVNLGAQFQTRPWVRPLERLLLRDTHFPTSWDSDRGPITVTWLPDRNLWSLVPFRTRHSADNIGRSWSDGGREAAATAVGQHIFRYDSIVQAMVAYWVSRPEHVGWQKLPNFTFRELESERYPAEWRFRSASADQEHVVCAMGRNEQCQNWIYWARYGQYIVEVVFFAANQWITPELFEQVVAQVDAYVTKELMGANAAIGRSSLP